MNNEILETEDLFGGCDDLFDGGEFVSFHLVKFGPEMVVGT